jgi:hypothetical protein
MDGIFADWPDVAEEVLEERPLDVAELDMVRVSFLGGAGFSPSCVWSLIG